MKRIEKIKIDLKEKDFRELTLKQMDTTQLIFCISDKETPLNLSEYTADLIFTKPNGTIVIQEITINNQDNVLEANLKEDCVRDYGKGKIEVELKENEEVISSFQLTCKIEKTGKDFKPSGNNDNYYEKAEKLLKELNQKVENGEFDGKTPVKGKDYFDENDKKEIVNTVITTIDEKYELKHTNYHVVVTEEIEELTEYELPFSYTVGNDSLVVFLNNERLICEKTEDDQANYKEVGETGATSNKLIFGFTLDVGDILDFIVKGVVEDE